MIGNEDRLSWKLQSQDPTVATSYSDVVDLILGESARAIVFKGYDKTSGRKILRH